MAKPRQKRRTTPDGTTVAAKNANGEGSIYLDSRGRWKATYRDRTGKRRTVSAGTKGEAAKRRDAKVAELAAKAPSGRLGPAPTVAELADFWLADIAATQVRPSTLHTYRKDVARIVDGLGSELVAELDAEMVRRWLAAMRRAGLAASTCRNARTRLRQVAQAGVELGHLAANPVVSVPAPKPTADERHARRSLTAEEVRRLLAVCDGTRTFDAAVAMLFTSGNRASEVLGLAWSDLDADAGTATVRRACTYTGGGIGARLDKPKTATTAGVHHLAPTVATLLRLRRVAQAHERLAAGPAWETVTYEGQVVDLVFTTAAGGLPLRQSLYEAVTDACRRAGIDPAGVGTHTGRRSVVTGLYVAGLPLDDVARHVGHASPTTTAAYVTDLGTRPQDTAALAARLLDPATGDA